MKTHCVLYIKPRRPTTTSHNSTFDRTVGSHSLAAAGQRYAAVR